MSSEYKKPEQPHVINNLKPRNSGKKIKTNLSFNINPFPKGSFKKNLSYKNSVKSVNNCMNSSNKINFFINSNKKLNNNQNNPNMKSKNNFSTQNNFKKSTSNNLHTPKNKKSFSLATQQFNNGNTMLLINIKLQETEKFIKLKKNEDIFICAKSFCFNNHLPDSLIRPITNKILSAIHSVDKAFNTKLSLESRNNLREIESLYNRDTKDSSFSADSADLDSDSEDADDLDMSSISEFSCSGEKEKVFLNRSF